MSDDGNIVLPREEYEALKDELDELREALFAAEGEFSGTAEYALQALRAGRIPACLEELEHVLPDEFVGFAEIIEKYYAGRRAA